jgi:hypothetical protein
LGVASNYLKPAKDKQTKARRASNFKQQLARIIFAVAVASESSRQDTSYFCICKIHIGGKRECGKQLNLSAGRAHPTRRLKWWLIQGHHMVRLSGAFASAACDTGRPFFYIFLSVEVGRSGFKQGRQ